MGSSSIWTRSYIQEHYLELEKQIIKVFDTRKEACDHEILLLQESKSNSLCINCCFTRTPSALGKHQTAEHIAKRIRRGEKNGMFGKHHTEETKQRLSKALKGRIITDEARKKIGDFHRGKIVSTQTKEKLSRKKSFLWDITDVVTNEKIVSITLNDFNSMHPGEFNIESLRRAASMHYMFHKRYLIVRHEAFISDNN